MNINLVARHIPRTQALVDLAHRRATFAFDRFTAVVRDIDIRVSDVNGPRGGTGIACFACLRLQTGGDVHAWSSAVTPEEGITLTISRLALRLRRLNARRQTY